MQAGSPRPLRRPPSLFKRPWFARSVLEVGAGQLPYRGVTHIVDKYPESNEQRGEDLWIPAGMKFFEGELEALPFGEGTRFDYLYARHIFEHVLDPVRSVAEINRVASRGYLETPSPFYEMICCGYPHDPSEMHTLFVWSEPAANALHVIRKSARAIEDFCDCPNGRLARAITRRKRADRASVRDEWFPNSAKTTRLYFNGPIRLELHENFAEPCAKGRCAFACLASARIWSSWPLRALRRKSAELSRLMALG